METRRFETFELQLREITDRYIVRSGYWPNLVEESVETKLGALQVMDHLIRREISHERRNLIDINQSMSPTPPTPTPEFLRLDDTLNPGGTD